MLTVDYDRLDLRAGDLLLDLGCGFGRHTYEALVRGADVISCDMALDELVAIRNAAPMMIDDGLFDGSLQHTQVQGDGTRLPYPDETFDKIIASEVLEHVPDDIAAYDEFMRILKPGGSIAVTVPATFPEKICWKISSDYHAPAAVGGHVRINTRDELRAKMVGAGLRPTDAHNTHGLHSPYWWIKCAVGIENNDHPLVKKYHDLLVWEITDQPKVLQLAGKVLDPVIGKSTVIYAEKPATLKDAMNSDRDREASRAA